MGGQNNTVLYSPHRSASAPVRANTNTGTEFAQLTRR